MLTEAVGYDELETCQAPCSNANFHFYECYHENPPGNVYCQTDTCLNNQAYYIQCASGAPLYNEDKCLYHNEELTPWRQQYIVLPTTTLTCVVAGNSDANGFSPVPGQPTNGCMVLSGQGMWRGKCFIDSGCDGTIVGAGAPSLGRLTCGL